MSRIITPPAILSFPRLATSKADDKGVEKYSAALVFPAGTDLTELKAAALEAAKKKFPGKNVELMFSEGSLRNPFRKATSEDVAKGYPAGSTFMNVRSTDKPRVVARQPGPDGKPVIMSDSDVKDMLYPGSVVKVSVSAFGYDREGNKGVAFGLGNVQKWEDGTRIDGRVAAEDEFSADLKAAPASLADVL